MNFTRTNTKRLATLLAVLVVCVASLVTVAYAYNATYNTSLDEQSINVVSESSYIQIDDKGESIPTEVNARVYAEYEFTYVNDGGTAEYTYTPKESTVQITFDEKDSKNFSFDRSTGILSVKLGTIVLTNKTASAVNVTLSADKSTIVNPDSDGAFENPTTDDIKFKLSNAKDYAELFTLSTGTDNSKDVEVWIVSTVPDDSLLNPKAVTVYSTNDAPKTSTEVTLKTPSFKNLIITATTDSSLARSVFKGTLIEETLTADLNNDSTGVGSVKVSFTAPADDTYTIAVDTNNGTYAFTSDSTTSTILTGVSVIANNSSTNLKNVDAVLTFTVDSGLVDDSALKEVSLVHGSELILLTKSDTLSKVGDYTLTSNNNGTYSLAVKVQGFSSYYLTTTADAKVIATSDGTQTITYGNISNLLNEKESTLSTTLNGNSGTLYLLRDVTCISEASNSDAPLNLNAKTDVVFDGNGHTLTVDLSNLLTNSNHVNKTSKAVALIVNCQKSATIRDLTLVCSDLKDDNRGIGIQIGTVNESFVLENVTIKDFGYKGLYFASSTTPGSDVTIKDCVFDNTANHSVVTIDTDKGGVTYAGGDHALQFDLRHVSDSSTHTITISGCRFIGNDNGDLSEIEVCDSAKTFTTKLIVSGCTFRSVNDGSLGDITIGSTPYPNGKQTGDDKNGRILIQDFVVDITAYGETDVTYRGTDRMNSQDTVTNFPDAKLGYEVNPVRLVLYDGVNLKSTIGSDSNAKDYIQLTISGNASVSGYKSGIVINGTGSSPVTYSVSDANTLIDVAANSENVTVALVKDIAADVVVAKNITIDLNGHNLTNSSSDTIIVNFGAKLTLIDSSESVGAVINNSTGEAALFNNGNATVSNISITNELWYSIVNHGNMTLSEVTIDRTDKGSSMIDNGYSSYTSGKARTGYVENQNVKSPSLTIVSGTYSGGLNTVKNDDNAILIINGGTFSNTKGATILNWNEATINDGTFINDNGTGVLAIGITSDTTGVNKCQMTVTGGTFTTSSGDMLAFSAYDNKLSSGSGSLKISNGTFNGDINVNIAYSVAISGGTFNGTLSATGDASLTVTGGTFSNNPSSYLSSGYSVISSTTDGTTVYTVSKSDSTKTE